MALKDRFRRALSRSDARSTPSSISTASTTPNTPPNDLSTTTTHTNPTSTPNPTINRTATAPIPSLTLTKTSTRFSRILTGGGGRDKKREKEEKKLEEWARVDEKEWEAPSRKYPGKKSKVHQETLRAFEWGWRRGSGEGRRGSILSGISPGASRNSSVDDGGLPTLNRVLSGGSARRRSSHGLGSERGGSRGGPEGHGHGHGAPVETVAEE